MTRRLWRSPICCRRSLLQYFSAVLSRLQVHSQAGLPPLILSKMKGLLAVVLILPSMMSAAAVAQENAPGPRPVLPLAQRIAHTDPAKYRHMLAAHNGPGALDYTALLDAETLDANLLFLHRGIIEPKSGIGAPFRNQCEEMFIILDGEAQFTIDGRTSLLKGPAGAPTRLGPTPMPIYNSSNKTVQWMNINIGLT